MSQSRPQEVWPEQSGCNLAFSADDYEEQTLLQTMHESVHREDEAMLQAVEESLDQSTAVFPVFPFDEHDVAPPEATCYTAIGDSTSPETAAGASYPTTKSTFSAPG